jgi:hypothetical protein
VKAKNAGEPNQAGLVLGVKQYRDGAECLFEWQLINSGVERQASNTVRSK